MKNGRKFEDLIGRRYGRLTVIGAFGKVRGERKWFCRCDCGTERTVYGKSLKSGITLSCGCFNRDNARKLGLAAVEDLTDRRFGRLVVRVRSGSRNGKALWTCKCDCGNEIIVLSSSLKNEKTKSCGCLRKECTSHLSESRVIHFLIGRRFGRLVVVGKEYTFLADGTRRGLWTCKCDCGKIAHVRSRQLISGRTKSYGCLRREVSRIRRYNPNLTQEERIANRNRGYVFPEMIPWKKFVLVRDDFTCQVCGIKKAHNTTVHHKDSWKNHKDKRFDRDNGVTVCPRCHREFHSMYPNGDNTAEQWDVFVLSKKALVA